MIRLRIYIWLIISFLALVWLAACAMAPASTEVGESEVVLQTVVIEKPAEVIVTKAAQAVEPTEAPAAQPTKEPPAPSLTPSPTLPAAVPQLTSAAKPTPIAGGGFEPTAPPQVAEERLVELEWPGRMRLGDSDIVRLAFIPAREGYVVRTEFENHQVVTDTLDLRRPPGYDLFAAAHLEGVGFAIAPQIEQEYYLPPGEPVSWRWTLQPLHAGQQRLSLMLKLRWKLADDPSRVARETVAYAKGLDVQVASFLGLSQSQALSTGWFGLLFGGGLVLAALVVRPRLAASRSLPQSLVRNPNAALVIDQPTQITLSASETNLLQSLFQRYARLIVEREFTSGYSGARTLLAMPVRSDGRLDAHTIVKIGERQAIEREYANYEEFVKHTLPPITARIQGPPVISSQKIQPLQPNFPPEIQQAALQYTFISDPETAPLSLGSALQAKPGAELLQKLFSSFGPNWWLQRRPYAFRLALEYDRMLPTHLVLEPFSGSGQSLDGGSILGLGKLQVGDIVSLRNFTIGEKRQDGKSLSLVSQPVPGQPVLRLRWLSLGLPAVAVGRVVATRQALLDDLVAGMALFDLPDPFPRLPGLLAETIQGTRSIIHGDLNLENVLVGPGGFVWLIDFAQTREGHTLFDFAHLEAELVAHILSTVYVDPAAYLAALPLLYGDLVRPGVASPPQTPPVEDSEIYQMIAAVHQIASHCLFNPSQPREYQIALSLACLGALKFANLSAHSRHLLYLTGAYLLKMY